VYHREISSTIRETDEHRDWLAFFGQFKSLAGHKKLDVCEIETVVRHGGGFVICPY
jgi:hypothetical protein